MSNIKLLIIGLDGAEPSIIESLVGTGELPFICGILKSGVYGHLKSTIPSLTFPAWTSFMTGTNPGKHSIFDFTENIPNSYKVRFVNSTYIRVPTIWELMDRRKLQGAVIAFPLTYPPFKINGIMISGFDAPIASQLNRTFIYPPQIYDEIKTIFKKPFYFTSIQQEKIDKFWHKKTLKKLIEAINFKKEVIKFLANKRDWDYFAFYLNEIDTVSHHFWALFDEKSPRYTNTKDDDLKEAIFIIYKTIDNAIEEIIESIRNVENIIILSDHGFWGSGDEVIFINKILNKLGFLSFKSNKIKYLIFKYIFNLALKNLPPQIKYKIFKIKKISNLLEYSRRRGNIDFSKTKAFSDELNYFPSIWINTKNDFPEGTIKSESELRELFYELKEKLEELKSPYNNYKIFNNIYFRDNIYKGKWVNKAPHIIIEPSDFKGYSYNFAKSFNLSKKWIKKLSKSQYLGSKGQSMNGSHRPYGIFIGLGKSFQSGLFISSLNLWDIGTVVLFINNSPIPSYFDGKIVKEIFNWNFLLENKVKIIDIPPENLQNYECTKEYSVVEREILNDKLKNLGYF